MRCAAASSSVLRVRACARSVRAARSAARCPLSAVSQATFRSARSWSLMSGALRACSGRPRSYFDFALSASSLARSTIGNCSKSMSPSGRVFCAELDRGSPRARAPAGPARARSPCPRPARGRAALDLVADLGSDRHDPAGDLRADGHDVVRPRTTRRAHDLRRPAGLDARDADDHGGGLLRGPRRGGVGRRRAAASPRRRKRSRPPRERGRGFGRKGGIRPRLVHGRPEHSVYGTPKSTILFIRVTRRRGAPRSKPVWWSWLSLGDSDESSGRAVRRLPRGIGDRRSGVPGSCSTRATGTAPQIGCNGRRECRAGGAKSGHAPLSGREPRRSRAGIHPKAFDESSQAVAAELGTVTTGTGTISGKVKTDKGEPVAGVVVRAEFQGDRAGPRAREWKNGDGPPPELDMQTQVQRYIEDTERGRAMRKETTTGENGEFTLTGLLDDRYSVQAYLKGCVITSDQQHLAWKARPGVWIDFTARRVIGRSGRRPPRRRHDAEARPDQRRPQQQQQRRAVATGGSGVAARRGLVLRSAPPRATTTSGAPRRRTSSLKEGATPTPLAFRLTARTGIRGRVHVPKGYAVDSLSIFALRYAGTAVPDESSLRRGQNNWASPVERVRVQLLRPRARHLAARRRDVGVRSSRRRRSRSPPACSRTWSSRSPTPGPPGLVVKVVAPDGSPVADASVRVYSATGSWDSPEVFTVRPKKDGAWVVVPKKDQTADMKDWFVQAHSERYGEKTVAMPAPEPASSRSTSSSPRRSRSRSRVRGERRSRAASGSTCTRSSPARTSRAGSTTGATTQIGPDGRRRSRPCSPAVTASSCSTSRSAGTARRSIMSTSTWRPGANTVAMPVPVVYSLTVIVAGGVRATRSSTCSRSGRPARKSAGIARRSAPTGRRRSRGSRPEPTSSRCGGRSRVASGR